MTHTEAIKDIMKRDETITEREAKIIFDRLLDDVWDYITEDLILLEVEEVRRQKRLEDEIDQIGQKAQGEEEI